MYEYFRGKLVEKNQLYAVIEIQGIGYKIFTPLSHYPRLPDEGEGVFLYTSWVIREASQTLYGFLSKRERDLFELLITLSGIGPKTGLSLVGHLEMSDFESAIMTGNVSLLSKVPGIGKKTAERLIVDLKGKFTGFEPSGLKQTSLRYDALNALMNLGYSQTTAEKAINQALKEVPLESELSVLISAALKTQRKA